MTIGEMLLSEFDQEMASTRKILECVPEQHFAWKPHEKSSTLGRLANHIALLPAAAVLILRRRGSMHPGAESKAELLQAFDRHSAECRELLSGLTDEQLCRVIMVTPALSRPLIQVLQGRILNHLIHHRGQLTVYLRMLEVPVPGMYGPSADEK